MNPYIAAALLFLAAGCGALWTLWTVHVCRSGVSPIPSTPKITRFRRAQTNGDEDPEPTPAVNRPRTGP